MTPLRSGTGTSTPPRPPGLTRAQAAARLAADGPNTVAAPPRRRLSTRIAHQLTDPLVALLLAAAVVTIALGDFPDAAVIALVVIVNTAVGVAQEVRADRAIAALAGSPPRPPGWSATAPTWWSRPRTWSAATWSSSRPATSSPPTAAGRGAPRCSSTSPR